ncbi:MAG TPA: branched-chain amino acid ABC transporter substrate-binding protein [Burkholderiaceae bacterium]|jgi:branched-chain amino acid transport system substrate-binding protein|nr:branched-chain amino acid ABC transporter substrate-binding protein [Burkholderiaceae bacterium]
MIRFRMTLVGAALAASVAAPGALAQRAETVRVAFIDPLSGPFAPVGQNQLRSWQYIVEKANNEKWAGNVRFEIVPFDNKVSPQESLTHLKAIIDQGIRYVVQGNGSSVALALSEAIARHNERNPGREIVYLNYAAVDPDLTNSKCNFWHFRLDANVDQKMEALTNYLAENKDVKRVFLINQNYSFGQQVTRAAKEMLARKRPDIQIVGDDLHPLGQVKDFAPYIAKIRQAGADTIITGNWGADLQLLIRAAREAGLDANFYTYYAGTTGVPTAMGGAAAERVRQVAIWVPNEPKFKGQDIVEGFKKKFNDDYYTMQTYTGIRMLSEAFKQTKSIDPVRVAFAMEGMKFESLNGEVEMRASDHQLQQAMNISTWAKVDGKKLKFDQENTGFGWRPEAYLPAYVGVQPTSCQMQRPAKPK